MREPPFKFVLVQLREHSPFAVRAIGVTDTYADFSGKSIVLYDKIEGDLTKLARVIPWKDVKCVWVEFNA